MIRILLSLLACLCLAPGALAVDLDVSDLDGDGLANSQEDKNSNGIVDANETDPRRADTDGGGESDGSEVRFGRNPLDATDDLSADPDGDGLPNGLEMQRGTDAHNPDTDGDGVNDDVDPFPLEKAFKTDADRDGIADEWEMAQGFNSANAVDALLDTDSDGLSNLDEFLADTDPHSADTDRDGIADGKEVRLGSDPDESLCLTYDPSLATTFADTANHFAETDIHELSALRTLPLQQAIVGGYDADGSRIFLPNRPVTRLEFLKMALLSSCIDLEETAVDHVLPFSDMDEPLSADADANAFLRHRLVQTAVSHHVIQGYPDGSFQPDAPVTRAEAVTILLAASRLQDLPGLIPTDASFADVPTDSWFATNVSIASLLGIVRGYDDGLFRPEQSITRGEAALIILRAIRVNPGVNGDVLP